MIVEVEGEEATPAGRERGRATLLAFAMCVVVGGAFVGTDRPAALAPRAQEPRAALLAAGRASLVVTSTAANRWQPAVWAPIGGVTGSIGPAGANGRVVLVYVGAPPVGARFGASDGFFIVDDGADVVDIGGISD